MKSVVVFCSSSSQVSPIYFSEMELLTRQLVAQNFRIVYGGARVGLMGHLADVALRAGGQVVGVIPRYLAQPHIVHSGLTELIVVDDLLDRKKKMLSLVDAAIAAPGGMGTIDEITEVIALKQLAEHNKPIYFHNFLDFWSPLIDYFEELRMRGMISQNLEELFSVFEDQEALVQDLSSKMKGAKAATAIAGRSL